MSNPTKIVNGILIELAGAELEAYNASLPTPEQILAKKLEAAKARKKTEIKAFRETCLEKPTPQSITYQGNLSNRSFDVSVKIHLPLFESISAKLRRRIAAGEINPTREWTDSSGNRLELTADDYESLANHLDHRDEQAHTQSDLKIKAIAALTTVAEVEAFDVSAVI